MGTIDGILTYTGDININSAAGTPANKIYTMLGSNFTSRYQGALTCAQGGTEQWTPRLEGGEFAANYTPSAITHTSGTTHYESIGGNIKGRTTGLPVISYSAGIATFAAIGGNFTSINTGANITGQGDLPTTAIAGRFEASGLDTNIAIQVIAGTSELLDTNIGDGTNETQFEADGTLKFSGTATVWNDVQFQISDAKVTPASLLPSWETFTTNTSEYAFSVNDEVDTSANEIPHWWKEGTIGHAHIHITTKAINNTEVTYAKFTITFAYADTNEVWVEAPLTAELTIANPTAALTNFYLDLGDITLTNYLTEAQIRCRVKRIAATTGTEYVGDIFITQVGIHFEQDTIGTRSEKTK